MKNLLCSFLLLCSTGLFAQQYGFVSYNVSEGLAQSQVNCLFQDSRGFIWCGTLGGLSRFDGRKFENYSRRQGLLSNHITCISEDSLGRVIVGSPGAVAIIEYGKLKSFALPEGFEKKQVNDIFIDKEAIWLATSGGLLKLDDEGVSRVAADNSCYAQNIKRIIKDGDSWIVGTRDRVFRYRGNEVETLFEAHANQILFDVELTPNRELWVACKDQGLLRFFENDAVSTLGVADGLVSSTITEISQNGKVLWFASEHGLAMWDHEKLTTYTEKNGLPTSSINATLVDREGVLWIGSAGGGLIKFAGEKFVSYTQEHGLCGNAVMGITEDDTGKLWFATYEGEICSLQDGQFESFSKTHSGVKSNQFWSCAHDGWGNLWFGSANGLLKVGQNSTEWINQEQGLNHRKVLSLLPTKDGFLYIGTARGLNKLDISTSVVQKVDEVPMTRIRSIYQAPSGELWLASNKGVFLLEEGGMQTFDTRQGLSSNSTYCLEMDERGRVWVGTDNGLSILDGDSIVCPIIDLSFGSNIINFIKMVDGVMLIGSNSGLFSCQPQDLKDISFENFNVQDGLISLETNLNSVFVDDDKHLWFGTSAGLVNADLNVLFEEKSTEKPLLVLQDVKVNLESIDWEEKGIPVMIDSGLPPSLDLAHTDNNLTFSFTGICTENPEEISYSYILEGYDADWQPPTKVDFVQYRNLPYEDFVFRVVALNGAGVRSDERQMTVCIHPPFWLSYWFLALAGLAVGGTVLWIFMRRQKALLTQIEKERFENKSKMLALEQQALNSSMNRHFIFNALNSIQYYINKKDRMTANKYLSAFAKLIRKNLDSSQRNVSTLREELERLELYLQLEHMRFQDKFEYEIEVDESIDRDQIMVPAMLLQPFLENSIWHGILPGDKWGEIKVKITQDQGSIVFTIRDNGIGIGTSLKNKSKSETHISQGMNITSGRLDLIKKTSGETVEMHGPYEVVEDDGRVAGTEVRIVLPNNFHDFYPN